MTAVIFTSAWPDDINATSNGSAPALAPTQWHEFGDGDLGRSVAEHQENHTLLFSYYFILFMHYCALFVSFPYFLPRLVAKSRIVKESTNPYYLLTISRLLFNFS